MTTGESHFILDLTATRGRPVATLSPSEDNFELREWTTWLRIRSDVTGFLSPTISTEDDELTGFVPPAFEDDGLALMAISRSMDDVPGEGIGLFHARLLPDEIDKLRDTMEATPWLDLPRPAGGHYRSPTLTITYQRGIKQIQRSFSAASSNFFEAIAPLWRLIDRAMMRAHKTAASTALLELELTRQPSDPLELGIKLRLRARGVGHIVLADPRLPAADRQPPRLRVRVGELDPTWPDADPATTIELAVPTMLPEHEPHTLLLRPNARLEVNLNWRASRPGLYLIEACWQDYLGPAEPAPGQTPFMPLPRMGPSQLGSGPYPIRGAMFASRVVNLTVGE